MTQHRTHPPVSPADALGLIRALVANGHAAAAARALTHPSPAPQPPPPLAPAAKPPARRHPHTSSSLHEPPAPSIPGR